MVLRRNNIPTTTQPRLHPLSSTFPHVLIYLFLLRFFSQSGFLLLLRHFTVNRNATSWSLTMHTHALVARGLLIAIRSGITSELPSALADTTPFCAANCITSYIQQEFPSCQSTDLSCLCKSSTSTGYTLGELAYACLATSCSDQPNQLQVTLYSICNSQQGLIKPTHTSLSLPPLTSSPTKSTSTAAGFSALSAEATPSITAAPNNATLPIRLESPAGSPGLTGAQAAGITIGAFAGLMLPGLIFWIFTCVRKRREKKNEKNNSHDQMQTGSPTNDPNQAGGPLRELSLVQKNEPHLHPRLQKIQKATSVFSWSGRGDKAQTIRPVDMEQYKQDNRKSGGSTRTVSQLLPEKPWPAPPPPPGVMAGYDQLASTQHSDIQRPPPIVFNEPQWNAKKQDTSGQLPLSLDIPHFAGRNSGSKPGIMDEPYVPMPWDLQPPYMEEDREDYGDTKQQPKQYYITNGASSPDSITPIDENWHRRKPVPASVKVPETMYPEKAWRMSDGSDTTFETSGSDEPTPPEDIPLTPAGDSPVHYPKIPRSSNQAVARSNPYAGLTQSQARVAQDSPLRGYGRQAPMGLPANPRDTEKRRSQQSLKSPSTSSISTQEVVAHDDPYEAKLSPSRRGNDLYLSVSMATPYVPARDGWTSH